MSTLKSDMFNELFRNGPLPSYDEIAEKKGNCGRCKHFVRKQRCQHVGHCKFNPLRLVGSAHLCHIEKFEQVLICEDCEASGNLVSDKIIDVSKQIIEGDSQDGTRKVLRCGDCWKKVLPYLEKGEKE